jgi:hypothetical protein
VSTRRHAIRLGAVLASAALALTACASSSIQSDASSFLEEHASTATRAAAATRAVEAQVAHLSRTPDDTQLSALAATAAKARRATLRASEWDISKSGEGGEEGAEEEDLPRAETEATEAADELARAMSVLETYTRRPSAAALARYRSKLAHGREVWNESISQLWYLAHEPHPPDV